MKRWAVLTVALYAVILVLITAPALIVYGLQWTEEHRVTATPDHPGGLTFPAGWEMTVTFADALEVYEQWAYWVWLAMMVSGQALLLLVPLRIAERRLMPRRKLLTPIIVSAFFLGNMFFGAVFSILCAVFKDDAFKPFEFLGEKSASNPLLVVVSKYSRIAVNGELMIFSSILGLIGLCWLVWLLVFYRFARDDDGEGLTRRITRWLLRGSILELLVAVPSHIIVRRRDDCCAPMGTFWGIATGLSIMLLCFGPGVFFLFAARFRRLRPKPSERGV